jgi:hypothetical protein
MGEAETDDNGDGTFSADEDEGVAHRFYRTVAP